jgi:hypothetical protein
MQWYRTWSGAPYKPTSVRSSEVSLLPSSLSTLCTSVGGNYTAMEQTMSHLCCPTSHIGSLLRVSWGFALWGRHLWRAYQASAHSIGDSAYWGQSMAPVLVLRSRRLSCAHGLLLCLVLAVLAHIPALLWPQAFWGPSECEFWGNWRNRWYPVPQDLAVGTRPWEPVVWVIPFWALSRTAAQSPADPCPQLLCPLHYPRSLPAWHSSRLLIPVLFVF